MAAIKPIALFLPALGCGGAERMMLNLAQGFIERGHEVDLLVARRQGELLEEAPARVRMIDLKANRPVTALPALMRYLRKVNPSALLASMTHTGLAAQWASMLAGTDTPCAIRQENTWSMMRAALRGRHRWLTPPAARVFLRRARIIAVSNGVADDLVDSLGVARERINVIYNPVISKQLLANARTLADHLWVLENDPPVILAVGRLVPAKGFDILIEAFARLRAKRRARLLILGEGPERGRLEAHVGRLGLGLDCQLPGYAPNPLAYMARARVFAMPSRWEGLPTVLIEALAARAAVVASDCPSGPREILDNGRFGKLVVPEDVEALSMALGDTLDRPMAPSSALERWLNRFSIDTSVGAHLRLLARLGGHHGASTPQVEDG